jgi:hypothetical protein
MLKLSVAAGLVMMPSAVVVLAAFTSVGCVGMSKSSADVDQSIAASQSTVSQADLERYTVGDVRMDDHGKIFVHMDRGSSRDFAVLPTDGNYQKYIDLAEGLEPGQQKRFHGYNGHYELREDGSIAIWGLLISQGASAMFDKRFVAGDPLYDCYWAVLGNAERGRSHPFLLYQEERVRACIAKELAS